MNNSRDHVESYYGEILTNKADLKTGACCSPDQMSAAARQALKNIHPEILDKFYGCGSPLPAALEGLTVLDLGCGTGRDAYILSQLVGERGKVIGVDLTREQISVAEKHQEWHRNKFGFKISNVEFILGKIENLVALGIADHSVDLVVSNCVLNLTADKEPVFSEIFRVLKPGGELYFSDIFADRRIPEHFFADKTLRGECLAGAIYREDFRRMLQREMIFDYRICACSSVPINDPEVREKIGQINFLSETIRTFKLEFEDRCEDYGQKAIYNGQLTDRPECFELDDQHIFQAGKLTSVCGNTAKMLSETRFKSFFTMHEKRKSHAGLFNLNSQKSSGRETRRTNSCC